MHWGQIATWCNLFHRQRPSGQRQWPFTWSAETTAALGAFMSMQRAQCRCVWWWSINKRMHPIYTTWPYLAIIILFSGIGLILLATDGFEWNFATVFKAALRSNRSLPEAGRISCGSSSWPKWWGAAAQRCDFFLNLLWRDGRTPSRNGLEQGMARKLHFLQTGLTGLDRIRSNQYSTHLPDSTIQGPYRSAISVWFSFIFHCADVSFDRYRLKMRWQPYCAVKYGEPWL